MTGCPYCRRDLAGSRDRDDLAGLCRRALGDRWFAVDPVDAQVNVLIALLLSDACLRHALWIAELVAFVVRDEQDRRAVLPGEVAVRFMPITADPYELLAAADLRRFCAPLIERVRRFVAGSPLSAVLEIDMPTRRARVTLQTTSGGRQRDMVLESTRLVHTSAQEISAGMQRAMAREAV